MEHLAAITERRPYNAVRDFVDANVEAGRGGKAAFREGGHSLTYGELQKESCRFASGLAALGFGQESRMAMLALICSRFPSLWGAIRGRRGPIPLNTLLTTEQYVYMLEDSRAAVLFVSEALAKVVEPALSRVSSLRAVIITGNKEALSTGPIPLYSLDEIC